MLFRTLKCASSQKRFLSAGFSLIEMTLALAIMAIVGATVAPLALNQIEKSKITAAQKGVTSIRAALTSLYTDTGKYPYLIAGVKEKFLYSNCSASPGTPATPGPNANCTALVVGWSAGVGYGGPTENGPLSGVLISPTATDYPAWNPATGIGWKGPYLNKDPIDPWGYTYVANVNWFSYDGAADKGYDLWVISAGANHFIDTDDLATTLILDDIGVSQGRTKACLDACN